MHFEVGDEDTFFPQMIDSDINRPPTSPSVHFASKSDPTSVHVCFVTDAYHAPKLHDWFSDDYILFN